MRNCHSGPGVYTIMMRLALVVSCGFAAAGQPAPWQPGRADSTKLNPMDEALNKVDAAQRAEKWDEAVSLREQARSLLGAMPVDAPQFPLWVQRTMQFYTQAGLNARARSVAEDPLARMHALLEPHPARIAMLNYLADAWENDGNWLRAFGFREQAANAAAAIPPGASSTAQANSASQAATEYIQLGSLYRKLGRVEDAANVETKMRALPMGGGQWELANYYAQLGRVDDAAVIYKALAESQRDPNSWQALGSVYLTNQRFAEAADAFRQAIQMAKTSENDAFRNQTDWWQLSLADAMQQAGRASEADGMYQKLLQEDAGDPYELQVLTSYSAFWSKQVKAKRQSNC